jgi:diguanylate cyclase (GGDEF)-like protein/PAS domain S-box-containing protein
MDRERQPGPGRRPPRRDRTEAIARLETVAARLLDAPRVRFSAATGRHEPFTAGVISSGEPCVVGIARADPDNQAYLGVPVRDRDGTVLGALSATDPRPRTWDGTDQRLLTDIADAVASVLALARTNRALAADLMRQSAQEDRLRESQQRINLTFDHAPIAEAIVGLGGRWLECNAALCRLLGYPPETLLQLTFQDVVHPDDYEAELALLIHLAGDGADADADAPHRLRERRLLRSDGEIVWVVLQMSVVRDRSGGPRYLIVQMEDMTERRRRAEELRFATEELTAANSMLSASVHHAQASEARYRALVDQLPDTAVDVYDREHRLTVSSDPAIERPEYRRADLAGRAPVDILADDGEQRLAGFLHRAFAGEPTRAEIQVGSAARDFLVDVVPLDPAGDGLPEEALVVSRDITEIKERERELARNEARWRAAFDAAPVGVTELTLDGEIIRANPAMCELAALSAERLQGTTLLDQFHPDDRDGVAGRIDVAGEPASPTAPVLGRLLRADGSVRWVNVRGAVMLDPSGQSSGLLFYFADITEEHENRQRVEASRARFAALVEHGSDVIAILDADLQLTYVSPASRTLFGLSPEQMLGSSVTTGVHPDDVERMRASYDAVIADPASVVTFDVRTHQPDETWRTIESTVSNRLADPAVMGLVSNCRDVTDRVEITARLAHQAVHDHLTGLPNRALILDRLDQAVARARRSGHPCAVLYIDLDRFKQVNDNFGHASGDRLLVAVAERLRGAVRPGDSVGRLGGDEFVLLADGITDVNVVLDIAERVRHAVTLPIVLPGGTVTVGCSVGISLSDQSEPETLLRRADDALYRAKANGRDRWELYDASTPALDLGLSD